MAPVVGTCRRRGARRRSERAGRRHVRRVARGGRGPWRPVHPRPVADPRAAYRLRAALGPHRHQPLFPRQRRPPEIAEVRKAENQQTNIGGGWHTDHSYDPVPAMGSILLARETPPTGGDTLFAGLGAAFDSLSDGMKATLRSLRAVHSADHIYSADGIYAKTDQAADLKGHDERTHAEHPVVIRHPATGREILYVNPAFTLHFAGWTRAESLPLLTYLYQVAMQEKFHCRVSWAPGSIAIWDNRSTWHCAMNDYQGHRRLMHRITIAGEPLV
nr:TauD/TfdA family dioxygenase [uncultured Sphingomonas sp.]